MRFIIDGSHILFLRNSLFFTEKCVTGLLWLISGIFSHSIDNFLYADKFVFEIFLDSFLITEFYFFMLYIHNKNTQNNDLFLDCTFKISSVFLILGLI